MEFTIKNRVISRQDDTDTIGYNGDYVCTFSVDAEWAGKTITARFVDASKQIREVLLVDGQCTAPLMGAGPVCVGVYAAGMTSTYIGVYYATSIKDLGGVTAPPSPDVYDQILRYLDESVAQVELSADAAAGSAADAAETLQATQQTAQSAQESADAAAGSALGAAQSLQSTLQASADAQRAISESEAAAVGAVTTAGESAIAAVGGSAVSGINSVNTARDNALTSVADSSATAVGAIETAQGSAVAAVEAKETEALGAIDAAVEEVEAEVAQISANASAIAAINTALNNDYASAIKPTVSGASINLTDSADAPIQDLKLYGNSTQDGTPTPDAPIDIVSVGGSGSVDVTVTNGADTQTITIPLTEPLRGVGDYKDVICEQNGQIGVLRNTVEFVFNDIGSITTDSSNVSFLIWKRGYIVGSVSVNEGYNEIISHSKKIYVGGSSAFYLTVTGSFRLGCNVLGISNKDDLIQWLSNESNKGTPLRALGVRKTPTFEPFSAEIQAQWRTLKTYYPTTNIINTDSANMDCLYVADTKNYIDNKLLELTANMVDLATMQMLDN